MGDCNRPLGLLLERKIIIIIIIVVIAVNFESQYRLLDALKTWTIQMAQNCVMVQSYSTE